LKKREGKGAEVVRCVEEKAKVSPYVVSFLGRCAGVQ
jgi:hypothetical protein